MGLKYEPKGCDLQPAAPPPPGMAAVRGQRAEAPSSWGGEEKEEGAEKKKKKLRKVTYYVLYAISLFTKKQSCNGREIQCLPYARFFFKQIVVSHKKFFVLIFRILVFFVIFSCEI